ncbi:PhzF family phenazine biosynthesis isomerase [Bacillus halotolerans]|uniref:PhzF family phenazine biosynthesis isomerase n=1 Tax=Bacillus halotolerans TaxID=260554 RepID=UPI00192CE125|nr:PhzF family phenazine biosynthesis isomerase [Bacillus halotolerans]MBL4967707.1 PhzF family phenazine biosynthesis isomerase [Bacillus halotolerans]MBL4971777.1 PhzF family phenazine biosynthesis isomerase [Bacillus halotolerans]MBT9251305.1 PhzF family phenazine biosynthesis isomerase [Bacillus halotolerans]
MKAEVLKYEAFTENPGKGNPAGVVLHGDHYTEEEMQRIAEIAGYSETSFIRNSVAADLELRYFTPGHEMNLCGHATVASLYALCEKGRLEIGKTYSIQTKAGILPANISEKEGRIHITLEQAAPTFKPFTGDREKLADALGITAEDFHENLPIVFGSTGIWTAIVPLKSLEASKKMVPNNKQFPDVLVDMPKASVHPFTFETIHSDSDLHGRHFSSPYSGTIEDPVTGTASGVMGAYMQQYGRSGQRTFIIEQGQEMGKDGRVEIEINGDNDHIKVNMTGTAVYSETRILEI